MSLKTDLIDAKALISSPEQWGKGRRSFPITTVPETLCAAGACAVVADRLAGVTGRYVEMFDALETLVPESYGGRHAGRLPDYNDAVSHADIMALFDRAINAAEA